MEQGLLTEKELKNLSFGQKENDVDYGLLYENRFQVLYQAFRRFDRSSEKYKNFCKENKSWLNDYSLYMAIKNSQGGKAFTEWDAPLRNREEAYDGKCQTF